MQSYHSLESRGVDLWNRAQESERWQVFRLGTAAHNVLMVNGQQQRVAGHAPLAAAKPGRTVVDLTGVYRGQLEQARRGVELRADRTVVVQDEFTAAEPAAVRWAMLTRAEARIEGPGRATLEREGKTLRLTVVEPAGVELKIYATERPPRDTDAPNPGTRMIGFETTGTAGRIVVRLAPGSTAPDKLETRPLAEW